jgi:hypothetical protein
MHKHLPIPPALDGEPYAPLVALLRDQLLSPKVVAERWGPSECHLSNLRRRNGGLPWIRLPTGAKGKGSVRYRESDLVMAEIRGTCGALTLPQVEIAIAACPDLTPDLKTAVLAHLRKALT